MKSSNPVLCCDKCFKLIAEQSTRAARLWIDLSDLQARCSVIALRKISVTHSKTLRLLEILGLLVSTDTKEFTLVKINKKKDDKGFFFCGGRCGEQ